jgi:hypothetical protein
LVGDLEAPIGDPGHYAVVDWLPRLGGIGLGEVEERAFAVVGSAGVAWLIEKPARIAGRE